MSLSILQTKPEFHALAREWNTLLSKSASHVPFLRHEYLTSWWETMGGGEWPSGKLYLMLQRNKADHLLGIAPFFTYNNRLMLIGSHEISDYLDLLAAPENLPGLIEVIFDHLQQDHAPPWETIDLYNLAETSPTIPAVKQAAEKRSWLVSDQPIQPTPCLRLPATWDAYLERLEGRYRHEIERKLRRAETYFLPVEWYIVEDDARLDDEIEDFLELMAYNKEKAAFLTDLMACQMKIAVHEAFQAGWIQLAFLTVGKIKAAGYLNFDFQDRIYVYNSGLNPMFENISPGWVLLSYLIQWAIENGRQSFDFMRGDETYKYQFGGVDRFVHHLQITRGAGPG